MTEQKTHTIELQENAIKYLINVLNRVQIQGQEAESIITLKAILSKPLQEAVNDNKEKEQEK